MSGVTAGACNAVEQLFPGPKGVFGFVEQVLAHGDDICSWSKDGVGDTELSLPKTNDQGPISFDIHATSNIEHRELRKSVKEPNKSVPYTGS